MWPFSKSQPVAASGILCEITDYHSHILPGVDDGVKTMNESLQILAEMKHQGVRKVWFTPHIMEDIPNTNAGLRERFQELKEKFRKPEDTYLGTVELNLAAEYMMDSLFAERLEADDLLPIYEGGYRYLLVETTGFTPPMNLLPILKRIQTKGYRPLLAHPERYLYMGTSYYCMLKQEQVAFQLNLPSLTGAYGTYIQKKGRIPAESRDVRPDRNRYAFLKTFQRMARNTDWQSRQGHALGTLPGMSRWPLSCAFGKSFSNFVRSCSKYSNCSGVSVSAGCPSGSSPPS